MTNQIIFRKERRNYTLTLIHCQSYTHLIISNLDLPGGSVVKNLPANAGDVGLIPGLGRSPGERNGNPLQYSCLGNLWWVTVHGIIKKSDTT